jgi:hypothetical protein
MLVAEPGERGEVRVHLRRLQHTFGVGWLGAAGRVFTLNSCRGTQGGILIFQMPELA